MGKQNHRQRQRKDTRVQKIIRAADRAALARVPAASAAQGSTKITAPSATFDATRYPANILAAVEVIKANKPKSMTFTVPQDADLAKVAGVGAIEKQVMAALANGNMTKETWLEFAKAAKGATGFKIESCRSDKKTGTTTMVYLPKAFAL